MYKLKLFTAKTYHNFVMIDKFLRDLLPRKISQILIYPCKYSEVIFEKAALRSSQNPSLVSLY